MKIQLNGESAQTSAKTVTELLHELGLAQKPVVVEHNQTALLKNEHKATPLSEGDKLEIVTLAAGG